MNSNSSAERSRVGLGIAAQQGSTLIIGLVTLLLLTVISVSGSQVTSMEEKMAGNARDRNLAFQAADSALRAAETSLQAETTTRPRQDFSCAATPTKAGYYLGDCDWAKVGKGVGCPSATTLWDILDCTGGWNDSTRVMIFNGSLAKIGTPPSYVIEEISRGKNLNPNLEVPATNSDVVVYRITARGTGGTPDAVAIVQSTFKK
jgi:type IV pilus assembly protein PilX